MAADGVDRRRHPRMPGQQAPWREARLRTGDILSLVDIGTGGMLVESARRLLPGSTLVVQLTSDRRSVNLRSRVLRCTVVSLETRGIRYRAALEFSDAAMAADLIATG